MFGGFGIYCILQYHKIVLLCYNDMYEYEGLSIFGTAEINIGIVAIHMNACRNRINDS